MKSCPRLLAALLFVFSAAGLLAQSTATLSGIVTDPTGAVVPGAQVTIHAVATGTDRSLVTDSAGIYVAPSLQPGDYTIVGAASGFSAYRVEKVTLDVDQKVAINLHLAVLSAGETVEVEGGAQAIDTASITVGQVIDKEEVQEIPLNGRHFLDLTVLTPGGVTGPANGNLTVPSRGVGAFSFLTAGNRDDSVNFQINGINLNDINNAQIVFQPSIDTTSEVKIDNSSPSAEYGRNSGSITNVSTRSGTNSFHGEVFDYLRNNSFDARNFFNPKGTAQIALKRNNFGGDLGGPIWKNKAFFFGSYEGLRQHQGLPVNTTVLTAAQASAVSDKVSQELLSYIPAANVGSNLYTGAINGPVNIDQGTIDLQYLVDSKDTIHAFYANQHDIRTEPTTQGNTLPGFGDHRPGIRQIGTLNETHLFTPRLVNEFRAGFNRVNVKFINNFTVSPTTLGYNNYPGTLTPTGGIPFTTISGTTVAIGGPSGFPSGRYDSLAVLSDATTYTLGRHSLKGGVEARRYLNANFADDPGTVTFGPSATIVNAAKTVVQPAFSGIQNFQAGLVTSFSITPQPTTSRIYGNAVGAFLMDTFKVTPRLTFEYGFRFEWLGTPSFGNKQAAIFNPATVTLGYFSTPGYQDPYSQNFNYMPRLGFIYDVLGDSKTVVRGGYSIMSDQPLSGVVTGLSSNPPFTTKVSYTATASGTCVQGAANCLPAISQEQLYAAAAAASISVSAVQPNFKNATTQTFNLNIQHELPGDVALSLGYYGSVGRHLRMTENINQIFPTTGVRAFTALSGTSPIDPGATLNSNVSQVSSTGVSNYNGMWLNARKTTSKGITLNATYQYTKSLDEGSTAGTQYTDITQPRLNYAPSDFDTRHRVSANGVYLLPFKGSRLTEGYQISGIVQWQTGNPLNLTTTSTYTGTSGVQHPTLLAPIHYAKQYVPNAVYWFAPGGTSGTPGGTVCSTVTAGCIFYLPSTGFGNTGRNGAVGPGFADVDASFSKATSITERLKLQLKVDVFDIFNHASFGNPGTSATAGSASFGLITSTRFPVGDLGSSRQLQLSGKFTF